MATGSGIQGNRGIVVSSITPDADFRTGEAELWDSVGRLGKQLSDRAKPELIRQAERRGKEDAVAVQAGEMPAPKRGLFSGGDVYEARQEAFRQSYVALNANAFDEIEAKARDEHGHDVEAYDTAVSKALTGFIQGAEPQYAVDIEQYGRRRIAMGRTAVADAATRVRLQEASVSIALRQESLTAQLLTMIREGRDQTDEFKLIEEERADVMRRRRDNPAIIYSDEEADRDDRAFVTASKAAVYTRYAVNALRDIGQDAALEALQDILRDPALSPDERNAAFESARADVNREINIETDRANLAAQRRSRIEQEMRRRIEDDAAAIEIGGPDTGLTEEEVTTALGPSGVADWRRKQAEAAQRNRLTGDLVGLPREEALRRAMAALPGSTATTIDDLIKPLKTSDDFDALAAAIRQVETANNPARVSEAGAVGAMQLLPDTARAMAQLEGVPYDPDRLLNDPAYNERLGRRYLTQLLTQFDGNAMLAATAYHAGPGLVEAWLKPVGTLTPVRLGNRTVQAAGRGDPRTGAIDVGSWLDSISEGNPRSAAYPRKVAEALGGGRASAEWRATQAQAIVTNATEGFASDPLRFASQHRLAALPDLNVDAAFMGGQSAQQWGASLRARADLGQRLASERGAPQRYLTNGERAAYKDRLERNPGDGVALARAATQAIGGRGARDLLAEIGQGGDASTAIHIADLAATGGDGRFADAAASGLTLKGAGQSLSPERRDEVQAGINQWRALLSGAPSLLAAVQNTAMAAALADEVNGVVRPPDYYVQAALGRTTWGRNKYGGAAEVNGASVIVPRWLNGERFDDALEALSRLWVRNQTGPIYPNGEPMSARDAARLRPVIQPDGKYRLANDRGAVAFGRNGRPFEIDMDSARFSIESALGTDAVRPD